MSFQISLSQAASQYGGTLVAPDCQFSGVSIDSRTIKQGDLFVALKGDRFDAHDYLQDVQEKACGYVVNNFARDIDLPQWVVSDTTKALGQLAAIYRQQFNGPLIGITGSSGKTTVKEMTASILSQKGPVLATKGNLNNHIGVPLTLMGLSDEHKFAVIEMGASAAGDIAYLCAIASPDITVINNILPAHVAGFGSVDAIARAKGEIYENLPKAGTAIVNIDEQYRDDWVSSCSAEKIITYSIKSKAHFTASDIESDTSGCYQFVMKTPVGKVLINLPLPGKHNIANALAAAACAYAAGATAMDIANGLNTVSGISGRMQRLRGLSGANVIDDSYNANPGSMAAAIDLLSDLEGSKILVMGDMGELGADAETLHGDVGRFAKSSGVDALYCVGPLSKHAANKFGDKAQHFDSKDALVASLVKSLNQQSVVLVKGSRSAGMEDVVNAIINKGVN